MSLSLELREALGRARSYEDIVVAALMLDGEIENEDVADGLGRRTVLHFPDGVCIEICEGVKGEQPFWVEIGGLKNYSGIFPDITPVAA